MSKLSRAVKFIFAIWIAALLLALPQAIQFSVVMQGMGSSCTVRMIDGRSLIVSQFLRATRLIKLLRRVTDTLGHFLLTEKFY